MSSAYVHSIGSNATIALNTNLISNLDKTMEENNQSFDATIVKLRAIEETLRAEANNFLGGYSIEAAQNIADNMGDLLLNMAMTVINGESAEEITAALRRNDIVDKGRLQQILGENANELGQWIVSQVTNGTTVSELTTKIIEHFNGKEMNITVDIGTGQVQAIGELFNVNDIQLASRQGVTYLSEKIFRESKKGLSTKGVYRKIITEILRTSKATKTQSIPKAIAAFLTKLKNKMLKLSKEIAFVWGQNPNAVEEAINKFIEALRVELNSSLKNAGAKMLDYSNTSGLMGEKVRAAVSKVADGAIITLAVGDLNEQQLVEQVNSELEGKGFANKILPMIRYQADNKESKTDLILCNTRTKRVARAQSKNHFVSYFTNDNNANENGMIENFRFRVEEATNLAGFIANLSQTKLGINLNGIDLSNIYEAIANYLWFSKYDSARPGGPSPYFVTFENYSPPDILADFEGAMEKLLAGQVTNLLGVTIAPQNFNVVTGASNIFYVLNGRMAYTADLVLKAIQQIENNKVKTQGIKNNSRLVNVKISPGEIPSPKSIGDPNFVVAKVRSGSDSYGNEMGERIINGLKVTVSLGTDITSLAKTSLII